MKYDLDIEFTGGPYDGYHYLVDIDEEPVLDRVDIPVNRNVIRLATGESPGNRADIRSVARYQLRLKDRALQYQFSRFRPVKPGETAELTRWYASVLEATRNAKN